MARVVAEEDNHLVIQYKGCVYVYIIMITRTRVRHHTSKLANLCLGPRAEGVEGADSDSSAPKNTASWKHDRQAQPRLSLVQ